jgi:hypothetical protein
VGALKKHQLNTVYCLKLQGKTNKTFKCDICKKICTTQGNLHSHNLICKGNINELKLSIQKNIDLQKKNAILENENKILRTDKKDLQDRYDALFAKAVTRPTTTNNRTVQINQIIQNMQPIKESDLLESVDKLTLDYHRKGAEGYAEFALEVPFKEKLACVDVSRQKFKYKDEDGNIVIDDGGVQIMRKLCVVIKDKSYLLSQEHYEELRSEFTEKQMDNCSYNWNEAAVSVAKYSNGITSEFCSKVLKEMSKLSKIK